MYCSPDADRGYTGNDYTLRIHGLLDPAARQQLALRAREMTSHTAHAYTLDFYANPKLLMEWVVIRSQQPEIHTIEDYPALLERVYLGTK